MSLYTEPAFLPPEPKSPGRPRQAPEPGESKSIAFRVSEETYEALVHLAEMDGRSLSSVATRLIEQGLGAGRHNELHRTIRETIRAEMRAEFEARKPPALLDAVNTMSKIMSEEDKKELARLRQDELSRTVDRLAGPSAYHRINGAAAKAGPTYEVPAVMHGQPV